MKCGAPSRAPTVSSWCGAPDAAPTFWPVPTLGQRIVEHLTANGASLDDGELADALGVHYQTVGYLERGEYNPSLHLALRIAEFFGLPVEVVFSTRPFPRISDAGTPEPPAAAG